MNTPHNNNSIHELKLLPIVEKIKNTYLLWYKYYQTIPKIHRHTLGTRIDAMFVELIEHTSYASFLSKDQKTPHVELAVRKLDTLKVLLLVLWETRSIDNKKYIALSVKVDEMGRMLGGWRGQLIKNSPKQ
jgi:hypothetical protein